MSSFRPLDDADRQKLIKHSTYEYDALGKHTIRPGDGLAFQSKATATEIDVTVDDMDGWFRFYSKQEVFSAELGLKLSQSLDRWRNAHPELQIQTVVPIARHGITVELHVWSHSLPPDNAIIIAPKESK